MDIQQIIQGGAVGISLVLIWLVYKISGSCQKNTDRIIDVIERNATVIQKLTDSVDTNTDATVKMGEYIKNGLKKNKL